MKSLGTVLRSTAIGMLLGLLLGWLLSLVSGNIFVIFLIGSVGTMAGMIAGLIHRKAP